MVLTISQTTQIELKPKDWIFLGKYLYIWNTPQLFSTVSRPNKVRYMGAPNGHKCKPSTGKIPSQQSRRWDIFHFVAGLDVTFLGDKLNYQPKWLLRANGSVAWYRPVLSLLSFSCLVNFLLLPVLLSLVTPTSFVVSVLTILQTTYIKLEPNYWIFLGKYLYIRNTPQNSSTVSSPIGEK